MIVLERRVAQLFRAALRRCTDGSAAQADQIPVLIRHGKNGILMHAGQENFTIMYSQPGPTGTDALAFPAAALGLIEGRGGEPVELASLSDDKATARWSEQGVPREIEFPSVKPERVPVPPEPPKTFVPMPAHFLSALNEASQSAAKQPTKYVLNCVLLKGKTGEMIGTDSRQLLVEGGFKFPFRDDVLIPRSGVFGLAPFHAMNGEVGIGRTKTHVAIRVGHWIFAFKIDEGRFPDFGGLIPRSSAATTRFQLAPDDAEYFLRLLVKRMRGKAGMDLSLTLDLTEKPCFRFKFENEKATELALPRSEASGKAVRLNLDLRQFLRAVELRFQSFEIRKPSQPMVARDGERTFLMMPISVNDALLPEADAIRLTTLTEPVPAPPVESDPSPVDKVMASPVKEPQPLAPVELVPAPAALVVMPTNGRLQSADGEAFDVFAEAEGLTSSVLRAAEHAGRLLSFLRGALAQPKVMQVVRNSLRVLTDRSAQETASK